MFRHRSTLGSRLESASLVRRLTDRPPICPAPRRYVFPWVVRRLPTRSLVGLMLLGLSAAVLTLGSVCPVAAESNDYAKIIMHIVPAAGTLNCNSSKGRIGCENMKTRGNLNQPYYAFVCVVDGDPNKGIAGVEFGIEYNSARSRGVDIYDWNLCGTLQFPMERWPASGTGNLVTWEANSKCQREEPAGAGTGVVAVAGYFYLSAYSADTFKVTRRPASNLAQVADCGDESVESIVDGFGTNFSQSHLGFVSFSEGATVDGYNPCGLAKPVEVKTWGAIKSSATRGR